MGRALGGAPKRSVARPVDADIDDAPARWRPPRCDIGHDV